MQKPCVVYIYGPPASGKSRLMYEVFGVSWGTIVTNNTTINIIDDYTGGGLNLKCDYVIITSNEEPDEIPIHMDHIFCLNSAEALSETKSFLKSIL